MIHLLPFLPLTYGFLPLLGVVINLPQLGPAEAVSKAELTNSEKGLIRPVFNVKTDFGGKGDGVTNDQKAANEATAAAKAANGGIVWFPVGEYVLGTSLSVGEKVIILGAGPEISVLKAGANLNADVIKGENLGVGGANFIEIERIGVNGNKAENAVAGNGINIDGQRVRYYKVRTANCRETGLRHSRSGGIIPPSAGGIDCRARDCVFYGCTRGSLLTGITDFIYNECFPIENTVDGIKTEASAGACVLIACHGYGAAEHVYNFEGSWNATGCAAEGASVSQVRCKGGGTWLGGRTFRGGGPANVPGFEIIENATEMFVSGASITDCGTGGAFKAMGAATARKSYFQFKVTGGAEPSKAFALGEAGTWSADLVVAPIMGNNAIFGSPPGPLSTAAAAKLPTPGASLNAMQVTGNTNITEGMEVTYPGHVVTLFFTGTPLVSNAGTFNIDGNFQAANGATLTLCCIGASWWEVTRKPKNLQTLAAPTAQAELANNTETEASATRGAIVTLQWEAATATRSKIRVKVGATIVGEDEVSIADTGVNFSMVTFAVPAGSKWKWEQVEGTVTKALHSDVLL
jgi:hypothetical protein